METAGLEYAKTFLHTIERFLDIEPDSVDVLKEIMNCTRRAGTISLSGVCSKTVHDFPIGLMLEKHLILTGGQSFTQKHWKICLEKIRSSEMDPTFIISHYIKLSQAPEYYKLFESKECGALKCFIRPDNFSEDKS